MDACLDYIESLEGEQRRTMLALHQFIAGFPQVTCGIRYRVPFFFRKSWLCYLNPLKNGAVELCFIRANELSNEQGLLDFKDRSQVAGVTYHSSADIREDALAEVLHEALVLDEEVKYTVLRRKNS
ncbi:MAG: DUF1801 domain-containing protein [Saprospiraceae bacterium]